MKELLLIAIGSAIVNNVVLSQFLGICPFLGCLLYTSKMASYCSRIILLKDGQILEELKREKDQDAFYHRIVDKMQEL